LRNQNQLLEADMVYIKGFSRFQGVSTEKLKQLAFILHACYGSTELALHCLMILGNRGAVSKPAILEYQKNMLLRGV